MLYTVGEMAKLLGIAASTLRYYDQEGLLPFVERSSGGVRVVPLGELAYVELVRHDLVFHLATGDEPLKVRGTIKQILDGAAPDGPLLQVSSGCVVNMDFVRLVKGPEVRMADGTVLPLSRARRKEALETFTRYLGGTL